MEQYAKCKDCRQGFFYRREAYHGRVRCVCDRCLDNHRKDKNRRNVAAFRARRKSQKRPDGDLLRSVVGGGGEGTELHADPVEVRGLYADMGEPDRTVARRKVGLT